MTNTVKDEQNVESASATTLKELKDTLWKAADKLRGSMDASQYKDIVLGLVFLKYVTDAFDARRAELRAEGEERGDSEEYIRKTWRISTLTVRRTFSGSTPSLAGPSCVTTRRARRATPARSTSPLASSSITR